MIDFLVKQFFPGIFMSATENSRLYTTNFDGTENPLSEGGVWVNNGLDWCFVQKKGGIAFGTQTGTGGYDDSYALLTGFPPDQTITAVVHRVPRMDISCPREVELLLRWRDAPHSAKGYECLFDHSGTIQIVRWNGPLGDFTVLKPASLGGPWPPIADGDTLKASIVSNHITLYRNGARRAELVDNSYKTGNPGIGFFRRNCGANSDFGYTSVTATGN